MLKVKGDSYFRTLSIFLYIVVEDALNAAKVKCFQLLQSMLVLKNQNPTTLKSADKKPPMQEANNHKPQYAQAGRQCREGTLRNTLCLLGC